jgi:hypothetical protein
MKWQQFGKPRASSILPDLVTADLKVAEYAMESRRPAVAGAFSLPVETTAVIGRSKAQPLQGFGERSPRSRTNGFRKRSQTDQASTDRRQSG